jgi:hypothetical protein
MKKRTFRTILVLGTAALLAGGVTSCTPKSTTGSSTSTSGQTQSAVTSIGLKTGTLRLTILLGSTVDYTKAEIELMDANKKVLETVTFSDHRLAHSRIDTSKLGSGTFDIFFKDGSNATVKASYTYEIKGEEDIYTATNWEMPSLYTKFTAIDKTVSAAKDLSNNFLEHSPFYVGTENALNLMPIVHATDEDDNDVEMTKLRGMVVKLTTQADTATELNVDDYFEADDKATMLLSGLVKFKKSVKGDFVLTFTYPAGVKAAFPDLSMKISVVDGYNITQAKELALINNIKATRVIKNLEGKDEDITQDKDKGEYAAVEAWKKAKGLPTLDSTDGIDNFIIQDDLTLTLADVPDFFVWQDKPAAEGGPIYQTKGQNVGQVIGSLKDWQSIYHHRFEEGHTEFNLFGNYHQLSLGDDFPTIATTSNTGEKQDATENNGVISGHTTLIGGDDEDYFAGATETVAHLFATGNEGVSSTTSETKGGILFYKPETMHSVCENVIANSFFTTIVASGSWRGQSMDNAKATDPIRKPVVDFNKVRFHDSYSAMIFTYGPTVVNVNDSELWNAGGPLIINQGDAWDLTKYGTFSSNPKTDDDRQSATLNIDKNTKLKNLVTGEGGWFKTYGAESAISTIKGLSGLMKNQFGKTIIQSDEGNEKLSFLVLDFGKGETGTGKDMGSLFSKVVIDGKDYVNRESGRSTVEAAFTTYATDAQKAAAGDTAAAARLDAEKAQYQGSLFNTDFGATWIGQYGNGTTSLPIFKTMGTTNHYMTVFSGTGPIGTVQNVAVAAAGGTVDTTIPDDAKTGDYMTVYYNLGYETGTANPSTAGLNAYAGSNAFGLLFGYYDA